jgi:hypothetical protein
MAALASLATIYGNTAPHSRIQLERSRQANA